MELFNDGWRFLKTNIEAEYADIEGRLSEFVPVDIPHDWLIGNAQDLYETGCGWYVRKMQRDISEEERLLIVFDGVYMDSTLYVNGKRAGDWKYGYSAFSFDITDLMTEGENILVMQVRFQSPNSRWYSGAGIYRNVWLHRYPKAHILLDGLYFHTEAEEEPASYTVFAEAECGGELPSDACCHFSLWKDESLVCDLGRREKAEKREGAVVFGIETKVTDILEWDVENPNCYTLKAELFLSREAELPIDTQTTVAGFKRMAFVPADGFFLNGRKLKLHGVCEHHDLGCLGAAFHKAAMRRKLALLKAMGVNALRTSHNMPAREVMELADEMGILVLSEGFDMWERPKTKYDYSRFFREWAETDVRAWIRRDRNHPCLLMWSIGNEIYDTHADAHGQEITRNLAGYVHAHDPKGNAPVTIGSNYMPWEGARKCADILKIAGYNYGERYYNEHHAAHPDWVIYGSEVSSTVQSRGVYRFPLSKSFLADDDGQCSCLGNSSTGWGAKSTEVCMIDDRDAAFSMGHFLWSGFDYIGEPTPYHTKNSYFGQLDTAGFFKDTYYMYQAQWTDVAKAPMVHVFPYWNFNEGQMIDVRICSNGARVELFVNDVSKGIQEIDHARGKGLLGNFRVPYEEGKITAVAYDADGKEISRETRYSFGDGVKLTIVSDKYELQGNGEDLAFLTIGAEDAEGHPVENAMDYVEVSVTGNGILMGLDNGDSTDYDSYKSDTRKLFNGKLLAVVGAKEGEGEIEVAVKANGLASAACRLKVLKAPVRKGLSFSRELCKKENSLASKPAMVRQIKLSAAEGRLLTKEKNTVLVEARIFPEGAADQNLIWQAVNAGGVELLFVKVEEEVSDNNVHRARVTAYGDGSFYVRCMSKSGTDMVRIISRLEFQAEGIGKAYLNPYLFVSAGLYTEVKGDIGNGNEKGITTARDGNSWVAFDDIDFGDEGADAVTISIFALNDEEYPLEIWLGRPEEEGSRLLVDSIYQKPSIWNVYQEETYPLSEKVRGVASVSIRMQHEVHIKGFQFHKTKNI